EPSARPNHPSSLERAVQVRAPTASSSGPSLEARAGSGAGRDLTRLVAVHWSRAFDHLPKRASGPALGSRRPDAVHSHVVDAEMARALVVEQGAVPRVNAWEEAVTGLAAATLPRTQ